MIFNLRDQPVSIDGRNDLYGDELLGRAIGKANGYWQGDPDLARANFVLQDRSLPLVPELTKDPRYRVVYQDHIAIVLVRQPTTR